MHRTAFIYLALAVAVFAVFWQVQTHDFVNFDDQEYVTDNPHVRAGLTVEGIAWAFTTFYAGNWHPLTWLAHMLDCQLFGLNPAGHHLTNVVLHLANTLLLLLILHRMTGALWRSSLVAALFAIHPLHVESVAWVAERKDVLSTLFWFLTIWAYLGYVKRPSSGRYLLVLVAFACGLMAKPMVVTLPFVLLLLDYWPLARMHRRLPHDGENLQLHAAGGSGENSVAFLRLLREKAPLLALAAVSSVMTFIAQKSGGAIEILDVVPVESRLGNALVSYVKYIGKMLWPNHLAIFYPHPGDSLLWWQPVGAALLLTGITLLVVREAQRRPYLITGWLWYVGTLVPVIGLVQVGGQAMADRYTYVPLIGLFVAVAWSLGDLARTWRYSRFASVVAVGAVLSVLTICTWKQVRYWRNSFTLFEHALGVTTNNFVAENNLANALVSQNRLQEAIPHYARAIALKPTHAEAYGNMGVLLARQGRFPEASAYYVRALQLKPDSAEIHNNLGVALVELGRVEEATRHYLRAIKLKPDYAEAYNNLGNALAERERLGEAIPDFEKALILYPSYPEAHNNLGVALARLGRLEEAISHFKKALQLKPDFTQARDNLEIALGEAGAARGQSLKRPSAP
jgi:Flp pilus assembly protein TadD